MVAFLNFVDFGVFVAAVDSGHKCDKTAVSSRLFNATSLQ